MENPNATALCQPDFYSTTFDWIDNGSKLGTVKFFRDGTTQVCCWTKTLIFREPTPQWRLDHQCAGPQFNGAAVFINLSSH